MKTVKAWLGNILMGLIIIAIIAFAYGFNRILNWVSEQQPWMFQLGGGILLAFVGFVIFRFWWSEKKGWRNKIVIGIVIAAIIALIVWAVPLAPQKDVIVTTKEIPLTDVERATFGYDKEALTAYCVSYVWDGEQDQYPQWVIFQDFTRDFEWIVLEFRDIGDIQDTDSFIKAAESASKFDKYWFDNEMHTIQRSRLENLQHIFFSGGDALEKERTAINQVLQSISSGGQ